MEQSKRKLDKEGLINTKIADYQRICDCLDDVICLFDDNGRAISVNKAARQMAEQKFKVNLLEADFKQFLGLSAAQIALFDAHTPFDIQVRFKLKPDAVQQISHPRFVDENVIGQLRYTPLMSEDGVFIANMITLRDKTADFVSRHNAQLQMEGFAELSRRMKLERLRYYPQEQTICLHGGPFDLHYDHLPISVIIDRVHPDSLPTFSHYINQVNQKIDAAFSFQFVMKSLADQQYRDFSISVYPEYDENQQLTTYVGVIHDISDEVEEHRHLQQYRRKTEILNYRYKISLWSFDPDTQILYSDNAAMDAHYHNYSRTEVLKLVHPDSREELLAVARQMINRTYNLDKFYVNLQLPDGQCRCMLFMPEVTRDEHGRIARYVFIARDVTEEKQAEFEQKKYIEHVHRMTEECQISLLYYTPGDAYIHTEDPLVADEQKQIPLDSYIQMAHPDDREKMRSFVEHLRNRTYDMREFNYCLMPFGESEYRHYRSVALPVYDDQGQFVQYGFLRIDVTRELKSQEMLRFSQHVGKLGAWSYDAETKCNAWTDEMFHIAGIPVTPTHEIGYEVFEQLIDEAERSTYVQHMREAIHKQRDTVFILHITTPAGVRKTLEERVVIEPNPHGPSRRMHGTTMDISDRLQLIEENEAAHALLSTILKSLPTMVFIKDIEKDFRFVVANDAFANFFGCRAEDIIGLKESEFTRPELEAVCRKSDLAALNNTIENPLIQIETFTNSLLHEATRYLRSIKFVQEICGRKLLMCAAYDVTDLQNARAKAEESDRLKSAFLANMSHEIRTPLNAIVGFSDLIANNEDAEENKTFAGIIQTNTEQLLRLISDILDLSKLEANMMRFAFSDFDVVGMLDETVCTMHKQFEEKGLALTFTKQAPMLLVHQDRVRVGEVVNNFLTNALKNTDAGEVTLWCEEHDERFRICVKDTGRGIPQDKQQLIFERFEKLDTFVAGTGLGLAVCKAIADALGGHIGVASELGVGSTFWVELPKEMNED